MPGTGDTKEEDKGMTMEKKKKAEKQRLQFLIMVQIKRNSTELKNNVTETEQNKAVQVSFIIYLSIGCAAAFHLSVCLTVCLIIT